MRGAEVQRRNLPMRNSIKVFLFVACFALTGLAQSGPCTEPTVRAQAAKEDPNAFSDDVYLFSGAFKKPIVGKAALEKAQGPIEAQRKNEKQAPEKPDRIVASASGDMAYEYGTTHVAFDEKKSGQHQDFTAAYLRVWKSEGGACKIAAVMFEPEDQK